MKESYLGIEIGGTKLQIVVADETGTVLEQWRGAVDRQHGGDGIRRQIENRLPDLLSRFSVHGVGVGFGGPVCWKTGQVARSFQIDGWSDFNLCKWLHAFTEVPVFVENDANAAALAEARHGAGAGCDPVFYVTLGSGVGGGLVYGGHLFHGAAPGECEVGHLRLDRTGSDLQSRCSGWAMDDRIRSLISREPDCHLAHQIGKTRGSEARHLIEALAQADAHAGQLLLELAEDLAFGLSHVVHLIHPEVIVLGGGLSLLGTPLQEAVTAALDSQVMEAFRPGPRIALASLGEDAVPRGAIELARRQG
jgi:glucokinase